MSDAGAHPWDVVRTMVPGYPSATGSQGFGGDYRLVAGLQNVPASAWVPQRLASKANQYIAQSLYPTTGAPRQISSGADLGGRLVDVSPSDGQFNVPLLNGWGYPAVPAVPAFTATGTTTAALKPQVTGDFDNGESYTYDGAYINKPDGGDARNLASTQSGTDYPYFDNSFNEVPSPSYFSPNRILPSPGMFGSLPTALQRTASGAYSGAWETLLFRPGLESNGVTSHPNAGKPLTGPPYTTPPDWLLMDLFWMPAVEPYAISTPFSTAGKINMNYQIAPFTYITRETALMAAMKAQKLLAIPQTSNKPYKVQNIATDAGYANSIAVNYRQDLNLTDNGGSLTEFQDKFNTGDIFRSAAQICDIDLVPAQDENGTAQSWSSPSTKTMAAAFWKTHALTGDNSRERPYTNLYSLLTTKSNTYTVHYRVQTLKKIPSTPAGQWVDGKDVVASEIRGSSVIERYVDAADTTIPDFALPANASKSVEDFYKFRVLSTKKFAP